MNFFEHQDQARSTTKKLVVLFALAVLTLIVCTSLLVYGIFFYAETEQGITTEVLFSEVFLHVSLGVLAVVILGSLFRMGQLKGGGRVVAESMGGKLLDAATRDPDERKILNVVEEMSIAAGLPVPPVYLMEESGINAFAAGYHQNDAVIGITRGCIQQLDRDELQGVIAHEFSHVFNGDMRLNIRLMGILYGILVIGLIGYFMMRGSVYSYSRRDKNNGIMFLGLGLVIIGYGGTFFGNIIKSAVSRQREFLADASAVQFTRNPDGISGALKKIGGFKDGSAITGVDTSEISHMLFEEGKVSGFSSLFATHPPLDERIRRIDPQWRGEAGKSKPSQSRSSSSGSAMHEAASGFASGYTADTVAEQVVQSAGNPGARHVEYAGNMLSVMPQNLKDAAHEPFGARTLVHALVISAGDGTADKSQLDYLKEAYTEQEYTLFLWVLNAVRTIPREQYLPMVTMAIPSLKQLSPDQYRTFMSRLSRMIVADEHISLFEWSLFSLLRHSLEERAVSRKQKSIESLVQECGVLLSALAGVGHDDIQKQEQAFNLGLAQLGATGLRYKATESLNVKELDQAIDGLRQMKALEKPRLLKAMVRCVEADGRITIEEGELLRTVAAVLDCPLPPLLND